jgi:allophanate hydrolase
LAELEAEPIRENSRLRIHTNFVNLLDMCGIAVPTGKRADGLPASVTLPALLGKDGLNAALARTRHKAGDLTHGATAWPQPRPFDAAEPWDEADGELIDLVVVGAHLSGMPLNHQLKDRGRLHPQNDAGLLPSLRLIRNDTAKAPHVARQWKSCRWNRGEVWKLASSAFGTFVAATPSPLGIGTICLCDGTSAKGFLVEPIALDGAVDITVYGGWRAYRGQ